MLAFIAARSWIAAATSTGGRDATCPLPMPKIDVRLGRGEEDK